MHEWLESFKEFPPRQKAASFTVDRIGQKLMPRTGEESGAASKISPGPECSGATATWTAVQTTYLHRTTGVHGEDDRPKLR